MSLLAQYVLNFAVRGDCMCGKCVDASVNPQQPNGHTANMTFFKVSAKEGANAGAFRRLVEIEFPYWLDGKPHSYIQVGSDIGDQGIALMCIGLGHLLGVWQALTPDTVVPFLPVETKRQLAGKGYIMLQARNIVH